MFLQSHFHKCFVGIIAILLNNFANGVLNTHESKLKNMSPTKNLEAIDRITGQRATNFVYEDDGLCEPIDIEKCKNLGYNMTKMPNALKHYRQIHAKMDLDSYLPLVETNCSKKLAFFLCAVHFPMCNERVPTERIMPCESMCNAVSKRCRIVLKSFGYDWPKTLDCSKFPKENGNGTLCMEDSGEEEEDTMPSVAIKPPILINHCR